MSVRGKAEIMKGKPWTVEEEKQLRELVLAHRPLGVIAGSLGKTTESIRCKMARMGLVDDNQPKSERSLSTKLKLPVDLPSVEEQLKAVMMKCKRLGLEVIITAHNKKIITSHLTLPTGSLACS
jgi:hypothetical protein